MAEIYRRCGCRRPDGGPFPPLPDRPTPAQRAARCPRLATDPKHASWGFALAAGRDPATGRRVQIRRMGYPTKRFESLVERTQLPAMTFHGLRHQHASLMIAQGIDLANVSKRLGHSSIAITNDLYGHLLRDANKRAAEAAEALVPRVSEAVVPLTVHTSHTRRARRAGTGEAPAEEFLF